MAIWNTRQSVIANIEADSEDEALAILATALKRAGFETYGLDRTAADAFEAEEGTTVTELPAFFQLSGPTQLAKHSTSPSRSTGVDRHGSHRVH